MKPFLSLAASCAAIAFCVTATTIAIAQDTPPLIVSESFETSALPAWADKGDTALVPDGHLSPQCLQVTGDGKQYQYPVKLAPVTVAPGQQFGLSCNYRTSPKPGGAALFLVFFKDAQGKAVGQLRFTLSPDERWQFLHETFTVPEKAASMQVTLRLAGVPATGHVFLDNLKLAKIKQPGDFQVTDFLMGFEDWDPASALTDRVSLGPKGNIFRDWRAAHVGEACFAAQGDGGSNQFPLWIQDITVDGGHSYQAQVDYRTTEGLVQQSNPGMLIFYFRDAAGKDLGQERLYFPHGETEWKRTSTTFMAPKDAVSLKIGLRLLRVPESQTVYIDHFKFETVPAKPVLQWNIDPVQKELNATVLTPGELATQSFAKCEVRVLDDGGKLFHSWPAEPGKTQHLSLKDWKTGRYAVQAVLTGTDGSTLQTPQENFEVYQQPSWVGNDIGKKYKWAAVPEPWKPLQVNGRTVQTWNNAISFSPSLQLQDIKFLHNSKPFLAAPLQLFVDGKDLFDKSTFARVPQITAQPEKVLLSNKGNVAGINVSVETEVTFDGLVKYHVTFASDKPASLRDVHLHFALSDLEYLNRSVGDWSNTGVIDLKDRKEWSDKRYFPLLWVGNMERGLYWMCPNLTPAKEIMDQPWVTVNSDGNVNMRLVLQPVQLDKGKPHEITFSLGVTPARPASKLWQTFRFRTGTSANAELMWSQPEYFKYMGFPVANDAAAIDKFLDEHKGETTLFYQAPAYAMTSIPQWSFFGKLWRDEPGQTYSKETSMRGFGADLVQADITQQTWTDLYLEKYADFLKRFPFSGVYHDVINTNIRQVGGKMIYNVFPLREYVKRIYVAQRNINPKSITFTHSGASFILPSTPFSDLLLMGEQYRQGCYEHKYYLEFLTLRQFRFENCTDVGPQRVFLPQYRQATKSHDPRIALQTMGLVLTHNLLLYPSFLDKTIVQRVQDRKFGFGVTNASFHPYWKPNSFGISSGNPDVICSFYENQKGLLLTFLNTTNKTQHFSVQAAKAEIEKWFPNANVDIYWPLRDQSQKSTFGAPLELEPYMAVQVLISNKMDWTARR